MSYTLYYWGAGKSFWGRVLPACAILEEAGAAYTIEDQTTKPAGCFAMPAMLSPKTGAAVSQVAVIAHTLGHELGMAPEDPAADAKALQLCCDAADVMSEADKEGKLEGDRKAKWLAHLEAQPQLTAASPITYADFVVYGSLHLCFAFGSSSIVESDLPPGLAAWAAKMSASKGIVACKALKIPMMPRKPAFE